MLQSLWEILSAMEFANYSNSNGSFPPALLNSNRDQNLFCLKYLLYSLQSFNQRNMTFPCSSRVINMQLIGNWNTPISCLQSLHFTAVKKLLSEHLMLCLQSPVLPKHGECSDPLAFWWGEGQSVAQKLCKVCIENQPCSCLGSWDKPGWCRVTAPPPSYISPAHELGFWDCWFCFSECDSAQLNRSGHADLQQLCVQPVQGQQWGAGLCTSLAPAELGVLGGSSWLTSACWMGYSSAGLILQ